MRVICQYKGRVKVVIIIIINKGIFLFISYCCFLCWSASGVGSVITHIYGPATRNTQLVQPLIRVTDVAKTLAFSQHGRPTPRSLFLRLLHLYFLQTHPFIVKLSTVSLGSQHRYPAPASLHSTSARGIVPFSSQISLCACL